MAWKMKFKSFITLFIVGLTGVVFCDDRLIHDNLVIAARQILVELRPYEDALLELLTVEEVLKVLNERFYYPEMNDFIGTRFFHDVPKGFNAMVKMYEKCDNKITIDYAIRDGEKLIEEHHAYTQLYKQIPTPQTGFIFFIRMMLGLFKQSKYVDEVCELFEHQFASAILAKKLIPEDKSKHYRVHDKDLSHFAPFKNVIPILVHDPRIELIDEYCKNITSNSKNDHGYISPVIDKWKRIDFKDVYNKYVERGRKRLQNPGLVKRMSTTDDALFTTEVCNTSDWVNFKSLDDNVKKYDRFECILRTAHEFLKKFNKFLGTSVKSDLRRTCVEKRMFSIEEINDVGINDILKDYDKEFLRIILKIWNEMSEDKEKKIKEKREEFIVLYDDYIRSLKWTCMTKDKDDVPFHDWLETLSILYAPSESIISYLKEFENAAKNADEKDAKKVFENHENAENVKLDELYQNISESIKKMLEKKIQDTLKDNSPK